MKTKYEMAQEIFIKRCPSGYLNDQTRPHFTSSINDALEIAEMFLEACKQDEVKQEIGE